MLFCYVRFNPRIMPLPVVLKPFIPDMVPAHPDVDAMIKVAMILTISQSAVITLS